MKDSVIIAIALGLLLVFFLGGLVGYTLGVTNVHREAVANAAGHWEFVEGRPEFAWYQETSWKSP